MQTIKVSKRDVDNWITDTCKKIKIKGQGCKKKKKVSSQVCKRKRKKGSQMCKRKRKPAV